MCGVAGFIYSKYRSDEAKNTLMAMACQMRQRGPDAQDYYFDEASGVGLTHARLSIQDLSSHGAQPMRSHSGRYIICYNGEIYNFNEIRQQIDEKNQKSWRGHSDTEVLLEAIECWGLESALQKCNGMFAFALFDRETKLLHLVRDRMGIKPLYYGWYKGQFIFASELKPFRAIPDFRPEIDRNALSQFFKYKYIPAPYSIYKNIFKLENGSIVTLPVEKSFDESCQTKKLFWSLEDVLSKPLRDDMESVDDVKTELKQLIQSSVHYRMLADVSVGTFLSGGIDSSLVSAVAQEQSHSPIKTFTIGFEEASHNEAEYAHDIAKFIKSDHHEYTVTAKESLGVIPELPTIYDEPFADSSQIPTYILSRFTREKVTVSLSGDGGDELFVGYGRYFTALKLWHAIQKMPKLIKSPASKFFALSSSAKLHKLKYALNANSLTELYHYFLQVGFPSDKLVIGASSDFAREYDANLLSAFNDSYSSLTYMDMKYYLPGDILTKVDRASMGVSLEARVPLLDHRIVSFAAQLPNKFKVQNGSGKFILKSLLADYMPEELFNRPKRGFSVPIASWLNGELRDWAEELLDPKKIKNQGYIDVDLVVSRWKQHKRGSANWEFWLWNVLMFQAWLDRNIL